MPRTSRLLGLLLVVALPPLLRGTETRRLSVGRPTSMVGETTWLFQGPVLCDENGGVYFIPGATEPDQQPDAFVRLSVDGKSRTGFSLVGVKGIGHLGDATVSGIALGPDGAPYALVWAGAGYHVVEYKQDGSPKGQIGLDEDLAPSGFIPLADSRFLVWGQGPRGASTRVITSAGRVAATVALEHDPADDESFSAEARAAMPDATFSAVSRDGQAYLARPTPRGPVFGISSAGEVVSRYELHPPTSDATLAAIRISGRRLAAHFFSGGTAKDRTPSMWITIQDLDTGDLMDSYENVPGPLVCYQTGAGLPDSFLLLGRPDDGGQMTLIPATGR